ncbi:MAG: hypothetical protein IJP31_10540 [Lachnospiraceae bacterium]|nr:hypothetical protein [Lachnospiraceae bacterium]
MKHAFLITAYEDFDWLKQTVEIYAKAVDCYIHIDKKAAIPKEFVDWASQRDGVHIYSRYKINWGSYKHISAILFLLKEAVKTKKYDYFHIISANSFITRSMDRILEYFDREPEKNYLEVIDLDETDKDRVIEPWYIYYHFLHLYNKRSKFGNNFDYYFCKVQKKLGIRRKLHYRYKGLVYCQLSGKAVSYIFEYLKKNPVYFKRLKTCNIAEEFFFQNILMNSEFRETVCTNRLLYDKWNGGGIACFLTEEDYPAIREGNYLFARKFGKESHALFEKICREI